MADFFKIHQRDSIYHYMKVIGGPGHTADGYQVVVNFLNENKPEIYVDYNFISDPSGLTGTWCTYEIGEAISKEEFISMYEQALSAIESPSTQ